MNIENLLKDIMDNKIVSSIIVIVISIIIYNILNNLISKSRKNSKIKFMISGKSETYIKMISSILRYIFLILTALIVLQINGVNVSWMMAGLGIVSVVVGLAIQDALKDIIRGFSILSDDYFSVGDVVKYENIEGKVLVIGLKTTKIRSIIDQNVIAIANRNIEKIQVVSKQLDIEVPLSYELKKSEAEKVITEAVFNIQNSLKVDKCEYRGINKMDDSSLNYLIRICCNQETKPQTRRDSICIIIDTLEKHGIEIPYNQIDVHNK